MQRMLKLKAYNGVHIKKQWMGKQLLFSNTLISEQDSQHRSLVSNMFQFLAPCSTVSLQRAALLHCVTPKGSPAFFHVKFHLINC
jgi:hypothetical protein